MFGDYPDQLVQVIADALDAAIKENLSPEEAALRMKDRVFAAAHDPDQAELALGEFVRLLHVELDNRRRKN